MTVRFKLIAAALGLVVAAGAVGEASAKTVVKTVAAHGVVHKTIKVGGPVHRLHFGHRIVKKITIVHRAPTLVKVVKAPHHKVIALKTVGAKKIVHVTRTPLVRHAMIHRAGPKVILR